MARWLKCSSLAAGALSAVMTAGLTSRALAQDGAMTELYGYGVHRFYAGDYTEAQRVLNIVVEAGIEDPRPHYFRGLTQQRLGLLDAAKVDIEHAADLEARGRRAVNVSYALQRVQGAERQEIEMARMMARVAVYKEQVANGQLQTDQRRAAPYIPVPPIDSGALPPGLSPGPDAVVIPPVIPESSIPTAPTTPDSQVDPFRDEQTPAAPTTPPAPPTAEVADPFSTDAVPSTEPPVPTEPATPTVPSDPFDTSVPPATPATPEPPVTPPADTSDPFNP